MHARAAAAAQTHTDRKYPEPAECNRKPERESKPFVFVQRPASRVYSSADDVHVGRALVVTVSRGPLQALVETVSPGQSVS